MKPVMGQPQEPPMAPAAPPPDTTGLPADQPQPESELPPIARKLVAGAKAILFDDKFKPVFRKAVESAAGFPEAAALVVFGLIERAQKHLRVELPHDVLWADRGVSDHLMDAVFGYGQGVGIPEAKDPAAYAEAMDMVEDMGENAEGGGQRPGAAPPVMGQPAAPPAAPPQEMV